MPGGRVGQIHLNLITPCQMRRHAKCRTASGPEWYLWSIHIFAMHCHWKCILQYATHHACCWYLIFEISPCLKIDHQLENNYPIWKALLLGGIQHFQPVFRLTWRGSQTKTSTSLLEFAWYNNTISSCNASVWHWAGLNHFCAKSKSTDTIFSDISL